MTNQNNGGSNQRKPLRLWPGVVLALFQLIFVFGVKVVAPDAGFIGVIGSAICGLLIVIWWLFFSRASWSERLLALVVMAAIPFATSFILHQSISGGAMGMLFPILVIPSMCLALVVWAVVSRNLSVGPRRALMVVVFLMASGFFALIRTGGLDADGNMDFAWRWTPTPEDRLLAEAKDEPVAPPVVKPPEVAAAPQTSVEPAVPQSAPADVKTEQPPADEPVAPAPTVPAVVVKEAEWPGFRGAQRDGVVRGANIKTDWAATPPVELWRKPIGPGWSSFAVDGDRFFTQEQRGDDEIVACYSITTGEAVWRHRDAARFWESNAGAGPRGTPTLSNGRVYSFGATGIVNALEASSGAVVWSRNAATDTGAKTPYWGFASSPLVLDDVVVVATAGKLVAYDIATGNPRWFDKSGKGGYSSPHLLKVDGVAQILLLSGAGAISVAPSDGSQLWKHEWTGDGIVQPAMTADGDVLLGSGSGLGEGTGVGVRRIAVDKGPSGWTVKERWTSIGLKPYFNDFVVHDGRAYGFDGNYLSCIDLKDGKRLWKGGRYGHGQLVLLAEQGLLLVLSEKGDLALVATTSDKFQELAKVPAIKGKTWNHPVLVGDVLLVRNSQEMVAFRLP